MGNTDFLNEDLIDLIINRIDSTAYEFAVGTGDKAEESSDTALETEVFRDTIDLITRSRDTIIIRCQVGTGEANGYDLKELGIFDSSNNMLIRLRLSGIRKTNEMGLVFNIIEQYAITEE